MRKLFMIVFVLIAALGCSNAENNEYYSYEYLKNDFDQVAVVASVDISEANSVDSIGEGAAGYVRYLIRGQVIEPFKGEVKSGQALTYYSVAEKEYNPENYRGNKIVFLNRVFDKQKKEWVLSQLENSTRPASKTIISTMRKIRGPAEAR